MSTFKCNTCNYASHDKSNFSKHNNSKKHKEKVQEQQVESRLHLGCIQDKTVNNNSNNNSNNNYLCIFCDKQYSTAGNLAKHKRTCNDKGILENEYKDKNKQLEIEYTMLSNKLQHLQELHDKALQYHKEIHDKDSNTIMMLKSENDHHKTLVNNAGSIIKTSVSTMAYVIKNYKDTPVLESIKDYSAIKYEQDNTEFIENLIYEHNHNKLYVYIGDFIIKTYKKDDPSKQSIWNSDTSRLTYLIREIIAHNKVDWKIDKKGIKTTKFIIEPILEYIDEQVRNYVQNFEIDHKCSAKEAERQMMKLKSGMDILQNIEDNVLSEEILKYITPHFYLTKTED